jgi:hypothetical protein
LRTLNIRPRNLNEIECSGIRLLYISCCEAKIQQGNNILPKLKSTKTEKGKEGGGWGGGILKPNKEEGILTILQADYLLITQISLNSLSAAVQ